MLRFLNFVGNISFFGIRQYSEKYSFMPVITEILNTKGEYK